MELLPPPRYDETAAERRLRLAAEVAVKDAVIFEKSMAAIAASRKLLDRINPKGWSHWPPYPGRM